MRRIDAPTVIQFDHEPDEMAISRTKEWDVSFRRALIAGIKWIQKRAARETSSGRFIPEIDGLRFIAISMVVLFHVNGYLLAKSSFSASLAAPNTDWLSEIASVGFRGVELFFVISGFILGLPFASHYLRGGARVNLRKYYLRRLTRLEPPYILAVLLLFLLALAVQRQSAAVLLPHLVASLFYLHSLVYGAFSPVIGVGWSLEIEIQFYLLVPLLTCMFMIRSKSGRRAALVAAILLLLVLQSLYLPHSGRSALSILGYLQFFLTGFILADIYISDWNQSPSRTFWWDLISISAWPVLFLVLRSHALNRWLFPLMVFLVYFAGFRGRISSRLLRSPFLTTIGGMCYSIYLLHYEVISAVGRHTKAIAESAPYYIYLSIQFLGISIAILIFCGIYFLIIEKPCMRRDWTQRVWQLL